MTLEDRCCYVFPVGFSDVLQSVRRSGHPSLVSRTAYRLLQDIYCLSFSETPFSNDRSPPFRQSLEKLLLPFRLTQGALTSMYLSMQPGRNFSKRPVYMRFKLILHPKTGHTRSEMRHRVRELKSALASGLGLEGLRVYKGPDRYWSFRNPLKTLVL